MAKREPFLIGGIPRRSVTETIDLLGLNKDALMQWVAWCGREGLDWNQYRDDAAALGSEVHACIERALLGEPQPALSDDPFASSHAREARELFAAWRAWAKGRAFDDMRVEQKLVLESCGMHGACDLVATEGGSRVLYDWKTSTKSKAKLEHWIQAAAYCVMLEDAGDAVDVVCIVTIDKKKRRASEERKTMDELTPYRELWWCAHSIAMLLDDMKSAKAVEVVG